MGSFKRYLSLLVLSMAVLTGVPGCASFGYTPRADEPGGAEVVEAVDLSTPLSPADQLLGMLNDVGSGEEVLLADGVRAVADVPYAAASGRWCRKAVLYYPDGRVMQKLACTPGELWHWAPAVTLDLTE